jgi:Recombination enhancement, RecA-dependent nuclease
MAKTPTKTQRMKWSMLASLGCAIENCYHPPCIHHCHTGAGGRKDHDKVLPLCYYHHQGKQGIHTLSRRIWHGLYGTENELMIKMENKLKGQFYGFD